MARVSPSSGRATGPDARARRRRDELDGRSGRRGATAAALSAAFTVYRYDRRGRGDSTDAHALRGRARGRGPRPRSSPRPAGRRVVYGISSGAGPRARGGRQRGRRSPGSRSSSRPTRPRAAARRSSRRTRGEMDAAPATPAGDGEAVELFFSWVGMPDEAVAQMRSSPVVAGSRGDRSDDRLRQRRHGRRYGAAREGTADRHPDARHRRQPESEELRHAAKAVAHGDLQGALPRTSRARPTRRRPRRSRRCSRSSCSDPGGPHGGAGAGGGADRG